jgi:hypothetical protein
MKITIGELKKIIKESTEDQTSTKIIALSFELSPSDASKYNVTFKKEPQGEHGGAHYYSLFGKYDDLVNFMTNFLSMTGAEADMEINDEDEEAVDNDFSLTSEEQVKFSSWKKYCLQIAEEVGLDILDMWDLSDPYDLLESAVAAFKAGMSPEGFMVDAGLLLADELEDD